MSEREQGTMSAVTYVGRTGQLRSPMSEGEQGSQCRQWSPYERERTG